MNTVRPIGLSGVTSWTVVASSVSADTVVTVRSPAGRKSATPFVIRTRRRGGTLGREQQGLRLEVVLHVAVIVEVVICGVRKRGNIEDDAVDAVQSCADSSITPAPHSYCSVAPPGKRTMTGSFGGPAHGLEREMGPTCVSTVPHSGAFGNRDAIAARIRYEVVLPSHHY